MLIDTKFEQFKQLNLYIYSVLVVKFALVVQRIERRFPKPKIQV